MTLLPRRVVEQWQEMRRFWSQLMQRDKAEAGPVTLNRRRVYILPTRTGFIFALVLLAMLIGAINYNNNLAYALTFLLAGMALVAMVHTFRNLHRLTFSAGHCSPVFAGNRAAFPLNVDNRSNMTRFAIELSVPEETPQIYDIEADDQRWLEVHMATRKRGRLPLPRVTVASRYPLGLFRAWGYVYLNYDCLIYPRPAEQRGLPKELVNSEGAVGDRGHGSDDFATLRTYHQGDSLRHVHWKALAREQGMLTKQFGGDQSTEVWLSWEQLPGKDTETRLAYLCRWVIEAETLNLRYGLLIPGRRIEPANGEGHRRHCLEALALYGVER